MVSAFLIYDLVFLVAFTLAVVLFLYTHKHNLKREGLLYLYRTRVGLKIIEWTSRKFAWLLRPMQYVVITSGYLLMAFMLWMLVKISYVYLTSPTLARALKAPLIFPLIPYLPEIFKLDFLPPFYFTYWIIVLAIVAITHEFFHGIFAKIAKVKTKTTGFGFFPFFLPVFLAAFVNLDEKAMAKKKKFEQMAVL